MPARTEQAQLIITIDAKESVKFRDILTGNKQAIKDLKAMKAGQEDFNAAIAKQAELSKKIQSLDISKISIGQLRERRKELGVLQSRLSAAQFAELGFARELQMVNQQMAISSGRTRQLNQQTGILSKTGMTLGGIWARVSAVLAAGIIGVGTLAAKYEKYSAMLKVALGSQKEADAAMELIKDTADETVFSIDELTQSYVKFANRGIKLTKDEILSLSDLAASQGKTIDQLTEAILDAQTGEFERLKEFGIRGSKSGDQATLSFKGFNSTVKLTPEAMKEAIVAMGNMEGVAGSNEEMMDKLSGRWSNFMDVLEQLGASVGSSLSPMLGRFLGQASSIASAIKEWISPTVTAKEETVKLQKEFNTEIGVLKRLRPEAEGRKQLIQEINEKYKDYLPNLIKESDGIKEIEAAQKAANVAFQEKLIFLAFEEEYQAQLDRNKKAVKELAAVEMSRARSAQNNQEFAGLGATPAQIEMQRKASENFIGAVENNAKSVIDTNDKVVADMEASYDKVAKKIGSSLDKIRKKYQETAPVKTEVKDNTGSGDKKDKKDKKLSFEVDFTQANAEQNFQENLDRELKNISEASAQRVTALQTAFLQEQTTEENHAVAVAEEKRRMYEEQLRLLKEFGLQESEQYANLQNARLENEKTYTDARIAQILQDDQYLLSETQRMFLAGLITEEEMNVKSLELQANHYAEQLRMLEEAGLQETETYKKIQQDKLNFDTETKKKQIENERRHAEMRRQIEDGSYQAFSDSIDLAIQALSTDEKARKKNASAIKTFEKAKIVVNTQREISEIWKNANANPTNALFPGFAQILAGVQSALAIGRAGVAIAKIDSAEFAEGGVTKFLGTILKGPSHAQGGIMTPYGEMEGDEAVINKRSTRMFKPLLSAINSYNGFGRQFALGGLAGSTSPVGLSGVDLTGGTGGTQMDTGMMSMFMRSMDNFAKVLPVALANIKSTISYESKQEADRTVAEIQKIASI